MIPLFENDKSAFINKVRRDGFLDNQEVFDTVSGIMQDIRKDKDDALIRYTKKFDKVDIRPENMLVTKEEIEWAYKQIDKNLLKVIQQAVLNVAAYSLKQKEQSFLWNKSEGISIGQKVTPLRSVGIYIPGGTAPLISSVIMNAVPAYVAGVKEIIMCTPPPIDCARIVAANEAHVTKIYKAGGAQAIFAMAFGTQTIKKVDKITGPGNIYVAYAKKMAYGYCGIDMVAGPSEIMIIADETADAKFIAADMLSQAEHDKLSIASLLTTSKELAEKVVEQISIQSEELQRKDIITESIKNNSAIYIGKDIMECIDILNECAPEHAEIITRDAEFYSDFITQAGAVFVGPYSPEPLGDYFAGPNHTLPTAGTARFFSVLGVYDFMKKSSVIQYDKKALKEAYRGISLFAKCEELNAHANAVDIRFEEKKDE
jgi:histidinol dehydrogenase